MNRYTVLFSGLTIVSSLYSHAASLTIKNEDSAYINQQLQSAYSQSSAVNLLLCGNIDVYESIKLRSNTIINECSDGATLTMRSNGNWPKPSYERAIFVLDKENSNKFETIHISNLDLIGSFDVEGSAAIAFHPLQHQNSNSITINDILVANNTISRFQNEGIRISRPIDWSTNYSISNVNISKNHFSNFKHPGSVISVKSEEERTRDDFALNTFKIYNITIFDNEIVNMFNSEPSIANGFGIFVEGAKHVKITWNKIYGFADEAIRAKYSYNVDIIRNKAINGYEYGNENIKVNAGGIKFNNIVKGRALYNRSENTTGPGLEFLGAEDIEAYGNVLINNASGGVRFRARA